MCVFNIFPSLGKGAYYGTKDFHATGLSIITEKPYLDIEPFLTKIIV